jgi:hypothetical protein
MRAPKRLGLSTTSFHSLRHTCASWMIGAGVDVRGAGVGARPCLPDGQVANLPPPQRRRAGDRRGDRRRAAEDALLTVDAYRLATASWLPYR